MEDLERLGLVFVERAVRIPTPASNQHVVLMKWEKRNYFYRYVGTGQKLEIQNIWQKKSRRNEVNVFRLCGLVRFGMNCLQL